MRVVVIGLGSMGRRRIRLMQAMEGAPEIVGVNRSAERRAQVEKEFGIRTFATLAALCVAVPFLRRRGGDGAPRPEAAPSTCGRPSCLAVGLSVGVVVGVAVVALPSGIITAGYMKELEKRRR